MIHLPQAYGMNDTGLRAAFIALRLGSGTSGTQNISAAPLGTPTERRRIYGVTTFFGSGAGVTFDAATIGGSSATLFTGVASNNSSTAGVGVFARAVPTGTTANIVLTYSGTLAVAPSLFLWEVNNQQSPLSSAEVDSNFLGNLSMATNTVSLNSAQGGFALMCITLSVAKVVTLADAAISNAGGSDTKFSGLDSWTDGALKSYVWSWSGSTNSKCFGNSFKP